MSNCNDDDDDDIVDLCTTEEEENNEEDDDDDDSLGFFPPPRATTTTTAADKGKQHEDLLLACEYIDVFDEEEKKDDGIMGDRSGVKDENIFEIATDGMTQDVPNNDENGGEFLPACECTNVFDEDDEEGGDTGGDREGSYLTRDCTSSSSSCTSRALSAGATASTTSSSSSRPTGDTTKRTGKSEVKVVNVIDVDDDDNDGAQIIEEVNPENSNTNSTVEATSSATKKRKKPPLEINSPLSLQVRDHTDEDLQLAAQLQAEENEKEQLDQFDITNDAEIAAKLQEEELNSHKKRKTNEEESMKESHSGKAWLFIQRAIQLHHRLKGEYQQQLKPHQQLPPPHRIIHEIDTVAIDDMVYTCEKLLECQEKFRKENHPTEVTIGYHYTQKQAMEHIKQHGLLSKPERDGVKSSCSSTLGNVRYNGAAFGDGIYTGNNPYAFKIFGEVGLLVATLRGKTKKVNYYAISGHRLNDAENKDAHTVIGNKMTSRGLSEKNATFNDEIVLRQSSQCLPLIQYHSSMSNEDVIWKYHVELQKLVDEFFNGGVETKLERVHDPLANMLGGIGMPRTTPPSPPPFFNSTGSSLNSGNMFGGGSNPSTTAGVLAFLNSHLGGGPPNMTTPVMGMGGVPGANGGGNGNMFGGNMPPFAPALGMTGGNIPGGINNGITTTPNNLGVPVANNGVGVNNSFGQNSNASMANLLGLSNGTSGSNIIPPNNPHPMFTALQSTPPPQGHLP